MASFRFWLDARRSCTSGRAMILAANVMPARNSRGLPPPPGSSRRGDDWPARQRTMRPTRLRRARPGGATTGRLAQPRLTVKLSAGSASATSSRAVVAPPGQARWRRVTAGIRVLARQSSHHRDEPGGGGSLRGFVAQSKAKTVEAKTGPR
jgi:hypothetical protein